MKLQDGRTSEIALLEELKGEAEVVEKQIVKVEDNKFPVRNY